MKLNDVITSYKSEKLFSRYVWGGLTTVYETGTLGVLKEMPSKRWTVVFQGHQNYNEEPTGRDMPFVLRKHG